jgi:hypothetical protein
MKQILKPCVRPDQIYLKAKHMHLSNDVVRK